MSIVATKDIVAGEEVLVSYNYAIPHSPAWYREQWFDHLRSVGARSASTNGAIRKM